MGGQFHTEYPSGQRGEHSNTGQYTHVESSPLRSAQSVVFVSTGEPDGHALAVDAPRPAPRPARATGPTNPNAVSGPETIHHA